jgi:hypothetical protein
LAQALLTAIIVVLALHSLDLLVMPPETTSIAQLFNAHIGRNNATEEPTMSLTALRSEVYINAPDVLRPFMCLHPYRKPYVKLARLALIEFCANYEELQVDTQYLYLSTVTLMAWH